MLPANALWKQEEARKTQRMAASVPILSQIFLKVKNQATHYPDAPYIVYQVPSFVFGYPLYNHQEAVLYVKELLEQQNYQVWMVEADTLFISWMKPQKQQGQRRIAAAPKEASYRPFVYDPASLQVLREKMDRNFPG